MPAIDMTKIYSNKNYKGNWVAMINFANKPRVVAYAKTLKEAIEKAEVKGFKMPAMMQIPRQVLPFVGFPKIIK